MKTKKDPTLLNAYAGRWVAMLGGQVVGQGGTPQQAVQAARAMRHKEVPEVKYMNTTNPLQFSPILERVKQTLPEDAEIYLVGGAIRDALLQIPSHDLDFAVADHALKTARKVANKLEGAYYELDDEHPTGRVVLIEDDGTRHEIDFAEYRGNDLEADLRGRDLTINAMAVHLQRPQELIDPLGGLNDLWNKQLRHCSETSFSDDPVRTLRAIRFAAKHYFKILPETRELLKAAASSLPDVSAERTRDELFKILSTHRMATSIRAMDMLGLLAPTLPELIDLRGVTQSPPHISDVWTHTLHTLENLEMLVGMFDPKFSGSTEGNLTSGMISLRLGRYREQLSEHFNTPLTTDRNYLPVLMLSALMHDAGKPHTKEVEENGRIRFIEHERIGAELAEGRANLLHLSNGETKRLKTIVKHHMRPHFLAHNSELPSRRAIYRFFRDTGAAGVDICILSVADLLAIYGHSLRDDTLKHHIEVVRTLLEAYYEHQEEQVSPAPLLDGNDIMREFDLEPGPQLGELIEKVREGQATGDVQTKGDALELIEKELQA